MHESRFVNVPSHCLHGAVVCPVGHRNFHPVKIILLSLATLFWTALPAVASDYVELSGASFTSFAVTATPVSSGLSITTTPTAQAYNFKVEFGWDWNSTPSNDNRLVTSLYEDGTLIRRWTTGAADANNTIYSSFSAQYTPTHAAHTYVIQLSTLANPGNVRLWTVSPARAIFIISPETDVTMLTTYVLEIECVLCILTGFVLVWFVLSRLL
ncbi:MAG TPA: hypothetical protein VLK33_05215 [Terriglobales bacterium]|nr:hypothetical protein [Terriglobales bacterium]